MKLVKFISLLEIKQIPSISPKVVKQLYDKLNRYFTENEFKYLWRKFNKYRKPNESISDIIPRMSQSDLKSLWVDLKRLEGDLGDKADQQQFWEIKHLPQITPKLVRGLYHKILDHVQSSEGVEEQYEFIKELKEFFKIDPRWGKTFGWGNVGVIINELEPKELKELYILLLRFSTNNNIE